MAQARGTLDALLVPVSRALCSVSDLLALDAGVGLLGRLGYKLPAGADLNILFSDVNSKADVLARSLSAVLTAYTDGSWERPSFLPKVLGLADAVADMATTASDLPDRARTAFASVPQLAASADIDELPRRLIDYLFVRYLAAEYPGLASFANLAGLTAQTFVPEGDYNPDFYLLEVRWNRLTWLFGDPKRIFVEEYAWGDAAFRIDDLLERLQGFLWLVGIPATLLTVGDEDDATAPSFAELRIPVYQTVIDMPANGLAGVELGLRMRGRHDGTDPNDAGIAILPYAHGELAVAIPIAEGWNLTGDAALDSEGLMLSIRPRSGVAIDAATATSASVGIGLARDTALGPLVLLGNAGASRLEVAEVWVRLHAMTQNSKPEAGVELGLGDLKLIISAGDGDGFLQKLLPPGGMEATAQLEVHWSTSEGLRFQGSGALELTVPIHQTFLDVIKLESVYLSLGVNADGVPVMVGLTGSALLGPITASVTRIGVKSTVTFPSSGGNLGKANIDIGFLPPTGCGLAIDAGGLVGGGFLEIDTDNARYAGVLGLMFSDIGITAIGLITTRMPDGSEGFSMLINIGVTFDPPIQLSMGFTLAGVGGLIGINRSMEIEVLQKGIRNRTLDSILFPDPATVVANANKIISDLRSVFPPANERFVVGPMVKIGYGSPTLITADIGIFLELPDPIRIVLMGQIEATLPEEKDAIVVIHLDVLGVLDFQKEVLTFQASLYDSRILTFEVFGDSAFLLGWGKNPRFAMSLGGFHPKFTPPPPPIIFADLKRLTVKFSSGSEFQISCRAYQALTPNSLQFGARVDLYASASGATVTGFMGFEALIYFSPFSFEVWIGAGVQIKYGGQTLADVYLSFTLAGPGAWSARGTARIKLLFIDVKASFNAEWGDTAPPTLPAVDAWGPLQAALNDATNWAGALPADTTTVELLRERKGEAPAVVVHPAGRLEVRQKVVPLGVALQKVNNAPVTGHDRFEIEAVAVTTADGMENLDFGGIEEFFARGQFENLSDAQRLSVPAFERMQGGIWAGGGDLVRSSGSVEESRIEFESILIQKDRTTARPENSGKSDWATSRFAVKAHAAANARQRIGHRARFAELRTKPRVHCAEERYCIANAEDLSRADLSVAAGSLGQANTNLSRMLADQMLTDYLALNPDKAGELLVVPEYEVEEAA